MNETGIACGFSGGWGWVPVIFGKMLAASTGVRNFRTPPIWKGWARES